MLQTLPALLRHRQPTHCGARGLASDDVIQRDFDSAYQGLDNAEVRVTEKGDLLSSPLARKEEDTGNHVRLVSNRRREHGAVLRTRQVRECYIASSIGDAEALALMRRMRQNGEQVFSSTNYCCVAMCLVQYLVKRMRQNGRRPEPQLRENTLLRHTIKRILGRRYQDLNTQPHSSSQLN